YSLPAGVSYVSGSGDGVMCAAPATGSTSAAAPATGSAGRVMCSLGTMAQGVSKVVTIAVQANQAGTLTSHFEVMAREPDDSTDNMLDLEATVIGDADMGVSVSNATVKKKQQAV